MQTVCSSSVFSEAQPESVLHRPLMFLSAALEGSSLHFIVSANFSFYYGKSSVIFFLLYKRTLSCSQGSGFSLIEIKYKKNSTEREQLYTDLLPLRQGITRSFDFLSSLFAGHFCILEGNFSSCYCEQCPSEAHSES